MYPYISTVIFNHQDLRQTKLWADYMQILGWQPIKVDKGWGFLKPLPFGNTVLKFPKLALPIPWKTIEITIRRYHPRITILEPHFSKSNSNPEELAILNLSFKSLGFSKSKSSLTTQHTILIDLAQNESSLWQHIRSSTKTKINKAKKLGITIVETTNEGNFIPLWLESARQRNFFLHGDREIRAMWQSFSQTKKAILLLAKFSDKCQIFPATSGCNHVSIHKYNESVLGGVMLAYGTLDAHYMYAFLTNQGRRFQGVGALLVWEAILRAKQDGYTVFDFEGRYKLNVSPKSWKGFSFFKEGFGGKNIDFLGSYYKLGFPACSLLKPLFAYM